MKGERRHESGLKQYIIDGEWRFQVCGFGPTCTGEPGWVTMAAESTDGHFCKVYADITANDTVVYNGFRIPRSKWHH